MGAMKRGFSKLGNIFKKVFAKLKKNLTIILIVVAVILLMYVGWAYLGFAGTGFLSAPILYGYSAGTVLGVAFLALGSAYYIDSGTAKAVTQRVSEAVRGAGRTVGVLGSSLLAGAVGGAVSSIPWYIIAGGILVGVYLFSRSDGKEERKENEVQYN